MLRALITKVKDKEDWERCQSVSHDVWLKEKVARETNKEKKALIHQKQVALQQHLDRLQVGTCHGSKMAVCVLVSRYWLV